MSNTKIQLGFHRLDQLPPTGIEGHFYYIKSDKSENTYESYLFYNGQFNTLSSVLENSEILDKFSVKENRLYFEDNYLLTNDDLGEIDVDELKNILNGYSQTIDDFKTEMNTKFNDLSTSTETKITDFDTRIDNFDDDINNINREAITVNGVEQYAFSNVQAGSVITIPNIGKDNFLIECFEEVDQEIVADDMVIDFTQESDQFSYNSKFLEVTSEGIKPKTSITLPYTKETITLKDGTSAFLYSTEIIDNELINNIQEITSMDES